MLTTGRENAYKIQTYLGNMFDIINGSVNSEDFDIDAFVLKTQNDLIKVLNKTEGSLATPLFNQETLDRINYIKNTPQDDIYTKEMKNLDYMSTVLESFADYADKITQNFINQGYIHPEVKNHLINTYEDVINKLELISKEE
jgi:hypothetical protein